MTLLKVLVIVTSLAGNFVVEGDLMCSHLNDFPTIMTECMKSVGISAKLAMRYIPNEDGMIGIQKEDLMEACHQQDLYLQTDECIKDYVKRCPQVSMDHFKHLYDVVFFVARNCNDDKLNLQCLSSLFRFAHGVGGCMDMMKRDWPQNTTRQYEECQIGFGFPHMCISVLYDNMPSIHRGNALMLLHTLHLLLIVTKM